MRGALFQRAPGAMHQLTEGLRTPPRTADQLSPAQSGMATYRPRSLIRVNSRIFAAHSLGLRHAKRPPRQRLRSDGVAFTLFCSVGRFYRKLTRNGDLGSVWGIPPLK